MTSRKLATLLNIHNYFKREDSSVEIHIMYWRRRICNIILYFFSVFGFFTVVPSIILSVVEKRYIIAVVDTLLYLICLFITFYSRISYKTKSYTGTAIYYLVGLVLLIVLGPLGIGEVWLFSFVILAGLLIGNSAALIAFFLNILTLCAVYILLASDILPWARDYGITPVIWSIKSINYVLISLVILVANLVFTNGFISLISQSNETRNASIIGLAKLAEYRDNETGQHLMRIQNFVELIARELSHLPDFKQYCSQEYIKDLRISSILHDIGKVGIQDSILLKPGPLTKKEFQRIKEHPRIGGNVINEIERHIQGRSLYSLSKEIALYHHEKWDGSGYPEGLAGPSIPLSARITALADVYDALISRRPYKEPITHEEAVKIIQAGRGSHFDPDIVDAFINICDTFPKIEGPQEK